MLVRALVYLLLPVVVLGLALVVGYAVPTLFFPHWSADARATAAIAAVPVAGGVLVWGAIVLARRERRGRGD